jgi:hypothetical protein
MSAPKLSAAQRARLIHQQSKDLALRMKEELQARLKYQIRQRIQDVLNALELERQLDEQLARTRTWSPAWWSLLKQIDRVRTQLCEWKGIQVLQRMKSGGL